MRWPRIAETFLGLSRDDRLEALSVAASRSGRAIHLLEKDIWVVWALRALFDSDRASHLVLKGGTSPSKASHAIARFSDDVDLTHDIRTFVPDVIGGSADAVPTLDGMHLWVGLGVIADNLMNTATFLNARAAA